MSDIRFNSWLHQSGTGGIHQDSAGNIGIGSTQPVSALDVGTGNVNSHNIHSTVTATSFVGNVTGNATGITTTQITIGDTFLKPTSIGIGATSNSGRNAGVSTAAGTLIYNSDIGSIQVYANGAWSNISQDTSISATGGTYINMKKVALHIDYMYLLAVLLLVYDLHLQLLKSIIL